MAQVSPAKPVPYGILKGFGVSMAISIGYGFLLMTAGTADYVTGFALFTFIPAFLILNAGVASYFKEKNQTVSNYFIGVVLAVGVDIGLIVLYVVFVLFLSFIGAAGAGGQ
jgi:hypothetical protein